MSFISTDTLIKWEGTTELHRAVLDRCEASFLSLLQMGVEVDARDDEGFTSLHYACELGHDEIAIKLLQSGADPLLEPTSGGNALHLTLQKDRVVTDRQALLETLLNCSANLMEGNSGDNAYSLAAGYSDNALQFLLGRSDRWKREPSLKRSMLLAAIMEGRQDTTGFLLNLCSEREVEQWIDGDPDTANEDECLSDTDFTDEVDEVGEGNEVNETEGDVEADRANGQDEVSEGDSDDLADGATPDGSDGPSDDDENNEASDDIVDDVCYDVYYDFDVVSTDVGSDLPTDDDGDDEASDDNVDDEEDEPDNGVSADAANSANDCPSFLFQALLSHHHDLAAALIKRLTQRSKALFTTLIEHGQDEMALWLVGTSYLHLTDADGNSLLHDAARLGHRKIASACLTCGNHENADGLTPLHCAVMSHHDRIWDLLLENGADPFKCNSEGSSPWLTAIALEPFPPVWKLLDGSKSPSSSQDLARTEAEYRALFGSVLFAWTVEKLLDIGLDVNMADSRGKTLLMYACETSVPAALKPLIQSGADLAAFDERGYGALHWATMRKSWDVRAVLRDLKRYGAAFHDGRGGPSALIVAAENARWEAFKYLLRHYTGSLQILGPDGKNIAHYIALSSAPGLIKRLSSSEQRRDLCLAPDIDGLTPFHHLCRVGSKECLEKFAECAPSGVVGTNRTGQTPLHLAAKYGSHALIPTLLRYGAGVNEQDASQRTPLHYAALHYHKRTIEILLDHHANISAVDFQGNMPLHAACSRSVVESFRQQTVVSLLLKAGCDWNTCNGKGQSAIHLAYQNWLVPPFRDNNLDYHPKIAEIIYPNDMDSEMTDVAKVSSHDSTTVGPSNSGNFHFLPSSKAYNGIYTIEESLFLSTTGEDINATVFPSEKPHKQPGKISLSTMSGHIRADLSRLGQTDGRDYEVEIRTVSGNIAGRFVLCQSLQLFSTSGKIEITATANSGQGRRCHLQAKSEFGCTEIELPGDHRRTFRSQNLIDCHITSWQEILTKSTGNSDAHPQNYGRKRHCPGERRPDQAKYPYRRFQPQGGNIYMNVATIGGNIGDCGNIVENHFTANNMMF